MQICTLTQTQPRQNPTTYFFTGWMPFLPPNQQCQSTDGILHCSVFSTVLIRITIGNVTHVKLFMEKALSTKMNVSFWGLITNNKWRWWMWTVSSLQAKPKLD